jgi:hypothetical protein
LLSNLEPSNASAQILYLNQMSDNKKAYYIHQSTGKHPHKIKPIVKTYAAPANVLENYKLVYEYAFV